MSIIGAPEILETYNSFIFSGERVSLGITNHYEPEIKIYIEPFLYSPTVKIDNKKYPAKYFFHTYL